MFAVLMIDSSAYCTAIDVRFPSWYISWMTDVKSIYKGPAWEVMFSLISEFSIYFILSRTPVSRCPLISSNSPSSTHSQTNPSIRTASLSPSRKSSTHYPPHQAHSHSSSESLCQPPHNRSSSWHHGPVNPHMIASMSTDLRRNC